MGEIVVPVIGRCRTCGAELDAAVRVRATPEWVARCRADDGLRRRIERAVVQRVIDRHTRACRGRRASARPLGALAS